MQGFIGYHATNVLPFQKGEVVTVPAGVPVKSMHPAKSAYVTKRKQNVTVHHTLGGSSTPVSMAKRSHFSQHTELFALYDLAMELASDLESPTKRKRTYEFAQRLMIPTSNPEICWPGTGGYWCSVDMNHLMGIEPRFEPTLDLLLAIVED